MVDTNDIDAFSCWLALQCESKTKVDGRWVVAFDHLVAERTEAAFVSELAQLVLVERDPQRLLAFRDELLKRYERDMEA